MIPNSANKIVNTTVDITQYINTEYFNVNNGVAYLIKIGKLRMIKVDVTLKKAITKDTYVFNFPSNFLKGMINTYFFGNVINRNGKAYEVAFYNQLASNNFSILLQVTAGNTIENNSRLIGEWTGFCSADINDISEEENKFITQNQVDALINKALKEYTKSEIFEESQSKQDELIQKLQSNTIQESTEEATSLHVEDASDLPAVLNIRGNHYQEVQEGTSNLAILQEGTIEQDGITVKIENGVGTVSGTNTSSATIYIEIGTAYLYKDKKYYIKKVTGGGGYSLYKNGKTIWFPDSGESSFSASETGEYSIRYSAGANAKPITTFKLSIYEISEQEWVQGKKSIPSLEYPSTIETVKGEMNVVVSNKNLYKITASDNNYNGIKLTVNQEEGYATATGTSTGYSHPIGTVILKAGDYVFSGGPANGDWNKQRLSIYVKNSEGVFESVTTIYKDTTYSVHLDKETEYRLNYVIPSGTTVNDEKIYPQVERDTVATEFVKHEEKIYNLAVQQEMLKNDYFDVKNNKEVHGWKKYTVTSVDSFKVTKKETRFEFEMSVANGNHLSNLVCNMFKKWRTSDYSKTACYIAWNSKFIILLQFGDCGFTESMTVEEAKTRFQEIINENTSLIFYYSMTTTEELDLTEEQKQVLNELNNIELFKGVNNIYTEQDLSLLQLNYTADTKMYIDNKIASIAGGN